MRESAEYRVRRPDTKRIRHMSFWESLGWMLWATVFIGYLFNISAITFQLIVFWYQYLTAIRTESHYFCSKIMFLL